MRSFLTITVLLTGCASAGRVMTTGDAGGVRFNVANGDRAVSVLGISVYEVEGGHRGRTVCDLRRLAATDDVAQLRTWAYGHDAGPKYIVAGCAPLRPGVVYGVNVYQGHCVSFTNFRLAADGRVVDLGPNDVTCTM